MEKQFKHKEVEERIYKMWEELDAFSPEGALKLREQHKLENKSETFSVLMPPPNANAPLHCGHATYAIQDVMARMRRMQGYKTLYVPGTDHAGFETQVVYERKLKKEGKSRFDFDSKTLYENVLAFVKENSDLATGQLKRLGMSADWSRNVFMLDPHVIETVYNTFEKMHADGLIYKDNYLVNYSPYHGTTFSNLETEWLEQVDPLYYIKYGPFVLATVRPETKFGDTAVAVNPKDKRYKEWIGKEIEVEGLLGKFKLKVIGDGYVDPKFGTGVVKVTPAHDQNDFEAGKRHNLEIKKVIGLDGKLTALCGKYAGLYVTKARKIVVEDLQAAGLIEKIDEKYTHNVLVDYKDHKPIEPMLLPNWFISMKYKKINLSEKAINAVESEKVKYNKPIWKKDTLRWLKELRDWPISRQTVFGIRIPVWYEINGQEDKLFAVFLDKKGEAHEGLLSKHFEEGYSIAEIKNGLQKLIAEAGLKYVIDRGTLGDAYIQETDTFDTWFSSGQWPLTTLHYPNGKDFKEFFPTSFMDSMWDILFFWIVRMIIFSLYLTGEVPYKQVYIHGRINDEKGQKMSKSKGNVIDPLEFIEKYGADALRMGILVGGNTAAKSTALSEDKVRGYRNFANKIWNMARFIKLMIGDYSEGVDFDGYTDIKGQSVEDKEILKGLDKLVKGVNSNFKKYRINEAGELVYQFMWHEVADKYIEHVKNIENIEDKKRSLSILRHVFLMCLKLLHPFMPFVTEEIWQNMPRKYKDPLIVS